MKLFGFLIAVFAVAALISYTVKLWRQSRDLKRESLIRDFDLPHGLFERLRARRQELTLKDCQLVAHALRQFFLAYLKSGRRFVSMPSQLVDDLWHEFILYTKAYDGFCRKAFGEFLHHTPAVALGGDREANAGLRRCFWYACKEENINPKKPTRLPLLFAIDAKLNIADGFRYVTDCSSIRRTQGGDGSAAIGTPYCGGDFGSTSYDGSTSGFGDSGGSGSSDGSGFFGGDGGSSDGDSSGCGGGGGGGGGD